MEASAWVMVGERVGQGVGVRVGVIAMAVIGSDAVVLEGGRVCDGEGDGMQAAGENMGAAWMVGQMCSAGSQ